MNKISSLYISFVPRVAANRGPFNADDFTESMAEIGSDLAKLSLEWTKLKSLADSLPYGNIDSSIDAWTNGLDGNNLWTDAGAINGTTYYDSTHDRPKTIREALDDIHSRVTSEVLELQEDIADATVALTTEEEERIGINIFDASLASSATSLDGKSERNRLNTIQLARDLYGPTYTLDNDGLNNLTLTIRDMVGALLDAHGGNWNTDISLTHSGISIIINQTDVNSSSVYDDNFIGIPGHLQDDLNQIRTEINQIRGTTGWTNTNTPLYGTGPDSLEGLLAGTAGTGNKSAFNPWGYHISNIDEIESGLELMYTKGVGSGLPNNIPFDHPVNDFMAWLVSADSRISGQYFRRMETGVEGYGPYDIYHGRNSYPIVQLVQVLPSVTISGQYLYEIEHNSTDDFTVTLPSGVFLVSGVVVSLW